MDTIVSEEQKLGRNRLAFAVTLGHTVKHVFYPYHSWGLHIFFLEMPQVFYG